MIGQEIKTNDNIVVKAKRDIHDTVGNYLFLKGKEYQCFSSRVKVTFMLDTKDELGAIRTICHTTKEDKWESDKFFKENFVVVKQQ